MTESDSPYPSQDPEIRRSPAYDKVPHRDDPANLPELSPKEQALSDQRAVMAAKIITAGGTEEYIKNNPEDIDKLKEHKFIN